jgi:hypothetical protein
MDVAWLEDKASFTVPPRASSGLEAVPKPPRHP